MRWGSARQPATNSLRTVFGTGMSSKLSPCTLPISRLPRQYSVPPKRCGWDVIPDEPCRAASILSFAPETAIQSSRDTISWMCIASWQLQTLGTRIDDAEEGLERSVSRATGSEAPHCLLTACCV